LGFSYSNPYNIIQQGKITQITLMDEFEIYKLLEEATGIKKYEKRLQ
jgi:chromosome segregation ATPase